MAGGSGAKRRGRPDSAAQAEFARGMEMLEEHPSFRYIRVGGICADPRCDAAPRHGYVAADSNGRLHVNIWRRAPAEEWAWAVAHARLHLGFGHLPALDEEDRPQPDAVDLAARCAVVNRFLATLKVGAALPPDAVDRSGQDEDQLAAQWRAGGIPAGLAGGGTAGPDPDQVLVTLGAHHRTHGGPPDWQAQFASSLSYAVNAAIEVAGGARMSMDHGGPRRKPWDLALSWFVSSYPLLGGIASGLRIVADAELARAHHIWIAAVDAGAGEVYINPLAALSQEEWRFVLAHEMLHAALRHGDRVGGRDPFLWNVAADYVINGWLVEMGVGDIPEGVLYDPELQGCSAEEVYTRITTDLRRMRKIQTLRGRGLGDILDEPLPYPGSRGRTADLDDFYRRALLTGFEYHRADRGLLPAGLEEEIRALEHPPLKWDAQLARWFDEYVPRDEPTRSYVRPSRRQSSTPDIPRPGRYRPTEPFPRATFGVVLDTSGSMDTRLLGKALGAIASYSLARDVPAARVVYCDAVAYDAGYVAVEDIAGRVRVKGRGGTVLQPGISLLQRAADFPADAPILVITDGQCDVLSIRREHAFLIPAGARLPFRARGPVFAFR